MQIYMQNGPMKNFAPEEMRSLAVGWKYLALKGQRGGLEVRGYDDCHFCDETLLQTRPES